MSGHKVFRRKVELRKLQDEPYIAWNEFISLIGCTANYQQLSEIQRNCHFSFVYDSEIQNGGHFQYFENEGVERLDETIKALRAIGAPEHSRVLKEAGGRFLSIPRKKVKTVKEFVRKALVGEYRDLDDSYYHISPDMPQILEKVLADNFEEFIELI